MVQRAATTAAQLRPFRDPGIERRINAGQLRAHDAPEELYLRYGIGSN